MSEETKVEAPVVVDLFVGSSKVVKTEVKENDFIRYELEDGRSGVVKVEQYESMAKEQAYEDGLIMSYKWMPASNQMYKLLAENGMAMGEMNFVVKQLQAAILENYEKAASKLFKRQITDQVTLQQVNEVIESKTELI